MDEKFKNIAIGVILGFLASIATIYLEKKMDIRLWANQEAFNYQKYIFEERLRLFERYQKLIHSPYHKEINGVEVLCDTQECINYTIEFKTTLALIREFFPNKPTKLIDQNIEVTKEGRLLFNKEILFEVSEAMSSEFNYELVGFGYKEEKPANNGN